MNNNEKTLHFISGLPRSGSTLIANLFKQNPLIHGESVSSLASLVGSVNSSWNQYETNKEYANDKAKAGTIKGILNGYHSHIEKPIVMDKDRGWIPLIGVVEEVLQRKVKEIGRAHV